MSNKTLKEILGTEEASNTSTVRSILSTESKLGSIYFCSFRCYDCNQSGKKFDSMGSQLMITPNGHRVRYETCTTCGGTGLLDYDEHKSLGLDRLIK